MRFSLLLRSTRVLYPDLEPNFRGQTDPPRQTRMKKKKRDEVGLYRAAATPALGLLLLPLVAAACTLLLVAAAPRGGFKGGKTLTPETTDTTATLGHFLSTDSMTSEQNKKKRERL